MHKHLCVSFPLVQQRALFCLVHTCFVGKSFSELSWDSGPALGTQDVLRYRGIVAPIILVGDWSLQRDLSSYPKLEVCLSSRRAEILVSPALTNLEVCLSTRRAEILVSPAIRSWKFLSSRRAEDLPLQLLKELIVSQRLQRRVLFLQLLEAEGVSALVVLSYWSLPLSLLEAGRVSALAVLKWFGASSCEAGHISEEELSEGSCEA